MDMPQQINIAKNASLIVEREVTFMMIIKPDFAKHFVCGMVYALGGVIVEEAYRLYSTNDPLVNMLTAKQKEKQSKERFNQIMSQTNLKEAD